MTARSSGRDSAVTHWDAIYATAEGAQLSWYQDSPASSLALIQEVAPDTFAPDGPGRCGRLPPCTYEVAPLAGSLGRVFAL